MRFTSRVIFYILLFFAETLYAANPNGYYDEVAGKKGQALKTALSGLLLKHTILEYNSLWNYFPGTDVRPDGSVWDMYSSNVRRYGATSGMNREHSFPKSWWGGTVNAAYTDINHLYPSDGDANMAKNNYPLGTVGTAFFNNGVTKVGNNTFPGFSTDAYVFEPADEYKGDFARTYFYMVTCYQDYKWAYMYMVDQNVYPTLKPWAINLLMKWHRQDPVSSKETNRNEAVFKIQNNRNPFIDYPQLAEYLWGDSTAYAFNMGTISTSPVLATPTNNTTLDFGYLIAGDSETQKLYFKGSNLKSSLSVLFETASTGFELPQSAVKKDSANAGTYVPVTFSSSVPGPHEGSVLVYDGGIKGSVKVVVSGVVLPLDSLLPPAPVAATAISGTGFTANWNSYRYAESYVLNVYQLRNELPVLIRSLDYLPETSAELEALPSGGSYYYTLQTRIGHRLSSESVEMPVSLLNGIRDASERSSIQYYTSDNQAFIRIGKAGVRVQLYDVSGRLLEAWESTGHLHVVNDLHSGVYLIRAEDVSQKIYIR